jgi:hypothetical protein
MAISKQNKRATVSTVPIKVKPFIGDFAAIETLAKAQGKERPEIVRMLISEALKTRRLKSVGKDEALDDVVDNQKKAMLSVLAPVIEKLESVSGQVSRLEGRVADEFDQSGRRINFILLCSRFIVFEMIVCRMLLRDYVHTVYMKFVESVGKATKDVEQNFNARLASYKKEAAANLDELTETGAEALHSLAERKTGFRDA